MTVFKAAECLPLPEPFGFDKARLACQPAWQKQPVSILGVRLIGALSRVR